MSIVLVTLLSTIQTWSAHFILMSLTKCGFCMFLNKIVSVARLIWSPGLRCQLQTGPLISLKTFLPIAFRDYYHILLLHTASLKSTIYSFASVKISFKLFKSISDIKTQRHVLAVSKLRRWIEETYCIVFSG